MGFLKLTYINFAAVWTVYMYIYISSAAKLVEWKPSSLQVQKYLGSTDTKQMHVEHKNRTKT